MRLQQEPFEKIRNGQKTIEVRLLDEKRKSMRVGDEIEFSLMSDPQQKIVTVVEDVYPFPSFKELYAAFDPSVFGAESKDDYINMYTYYTPEDEEKYGVVGIQINVI